MNDKENNLQLARSRCYMDGKTSFNYQSAFDIAFYTLLESECDDITVLWDKWSMIQFKRVYKHLYVRDKAIVMSKFKKAFLTFHKINDLITDQVKHENYLKYKLFNDL